MQFCTLEIRKEILILVFRLSGFYPSLKDRLLRI
jgi:hypothetical protein